MNPIQKIKGIFATDKKVKTLEYLEEDIDEDKKNI